MKEMKGMKGIKQQAMEGSNEGALPTARDREFQSSINMLRRVQRRGPLAAANREAHRKGARSRKALTWFFVRSVDLHEAFPNEYAQLMKNCEAHGWISVDRSFVAPAVGEDNGRCISFRVSRKGLSVRSVRNGAALKALCARIGARRRSPKEDDRPRVWLSMRTADGVVVSVPHKWVSGMLYPMLNISNAELSACLGKGGFRYIDLRSAFPRSLISLAGCLCGCPGILNEAIRTFLAEPPKELKSRILTALFRNRSATDDADERIRAVAALSKALRKQNGWSKRDLYYALAAQSVAPFQEVLLEMGVMMVARIDGAFVSPSTDIDEVNRRLVARGHMLLEAREKAI